MHIKRLPHIIPLISILVISMYADSFSQSSDLNDKTEEEAAYTIKKGDTLWDISGEFLKNPFLWPNIWESNDYIKNPDLIFPGNKLTIPSIIISTPETQKEDAPVSAAEATRPAEAAVPAPQEPVSTLMMPPMPSRPKRPASPPLPAIVKPVISSDTIEASGYVIKNIESYGVIRDSAEDRSIYAEGDIVNLSLLKGYIGKVSLGGKFTIFRTSGPVIHPVTKKKAGFLFIPVGIIEIDRVQGKDASGKIIRSYTYASSGDLIQPYSPATPVNTISKATNDIEGYIIEAQEETVLSAQYNIVYIDKGASDGIIPGTILYVIKEKKDEVIGELRIVSSQDTTATALIVRSTEPFGIGSKVITTIK